MTASNPTSRPSSGRTPAPAFQGIPRSGARSPNGMRSLFIAVAALGLGGAATGWFLTHRSEAVDGTAVAGSPGTISDPLLESSAPGAASIAGNTGSAGTAGTAGTAGITNSAGTAGATGTASAPPAAKLGGPSTTGVVTGAQALTSGATAGLPGTPGTAPTAPASTVGDAAQRMQQAIAMAEADPIRARAELTRLLDANALTAADRERAYGGINRLAEKLFFSPKIVPGDSVSQAYVVKRGDSLAKVARAEKLGVDWRFVQRINALPTEKAVHPDMRLKLVYGPFNAEVIKSEFRFNLYAGEGTERVMVASFPCGTGTNDSTPIGTFKVRTGSKLINPEWRNPRTGERFAANDPKNPIGERWIGLQGTTPETAKFTGYGVHGTVEPQSIGKQMSMGCVRLGDAEVQVVYELIGDSSTVTIRP